MRKSIHIGDHLILPFGPATKNDLRRIQLASVAADGIYLTSDVPCIYIDKSKNTALTLYDFRSVFEVKPAAKEPCDAEIDRQLAFLFDLITTYMPRPTRYELLFLNYYFRWLQEQLDEHPSGKMEPWAVFNALLPVPEMQIYVRDPLEDEKPHFLLKGSAGSGRRTFEPANNFRVDFGFWTGSQLVAIEIDGYEPSGYARDVRRDRLLRQAGVEVIHVLNTELERHPEDVIDAVLPRKIFSNWTEQPPPKADPFVPF